MTAVPLGPGPEFDRIRAIGLALGESAADLGDDCAFLPCGAATLCLSTDASVEGVHFDRRWLEPEEIGWRAAAAALSDLAAVGATPDGVLVALSARREEPPELWPAVMRGVGAATGAVGGRVLGGDLTAAASLILAVTAIGRAERPVRRAGARPGDGLWVTGTLGGARAALAAWRAGRSPEPEARTRFARPMPRIEAGRWLARRGATAMLDLSDGLAGDVWHLARASGVRIDVELDTIPLGPGVADPLEPGRDPAAFAAQGGEDYELLVTLPPDFSPGDQAGFVTRIGSVATGAGVRFLRGSVEQRLGGFDHFA